MPIAILLHVSENDGGAKDSDEVGLTPAWADVAISFFEVLTGVVSFQVIEKEVLNSGQKLVLIEVVELTRNLSSVRQLV